MITSDDVAMVCIWLVDSARRLRKRRLGTATRRQYQVEVFVKTKV